MTSDTISQQKPRMRKATVLLPEPMFEELRVILFNKRTSVQTYLFDALEGKLKRERKAAARATCAA